ncbi:hypothetical protein [Parvularcula lutaonensis]|uniref:Uncharacterized protein n=1 Tax=Parvularcula lutaonensis TaxID=491923 RepID=A0ABV7M7F5_9PROT|nr:hypothetical protein [Parvularcula lutaonensis]GGY41873.1 hypothetical protein GCM10007148_08120 [Parvularcula lutaonensis]
MADQSLLKTFGDQTKAVAASVSDMPTRRKVLLGGTAIITIGAIGLSAASGESSPFIRAAKDTPRADIRDLGDGFFLVDGWVLTADDLERAGE